MGDAAFELERVEWRWGRAAHLCLVEPLCLRDGAAGDEGEGEGHEGERTPRRGRVLAVHENVVAAVLAKVERAGELLRAILPSELVAVIDWRTLRVESSQLPRPRTSLGSSATYWPIGTCRSQSTVNQRLRLC